MSDLMVVFKRLLSPERRAAAAMRERPRALFATLVVASETPQEDWWTLSTSGDRSERVAVRFCAKRSRAGAHR